LCCCFQSCQTRLNSSRPASISTFNEEERSILERILQLKAKGYGKAKIILEIWAVNKGGSAKYKAAESEYERLVNEGESR
jgi:hypothetical protein